MLSICLSFLGGKMIIGGQDNSIHTLPPITFNYNNLDLQQQFGQSESGVKNSTRRWGEGHAGYYHRFGSIIFYSIPIAS